LAAHGIFRRDNPMFSALQLADGRINLLDLSKIRLDADLLTLSACNTGSSVAIGGDELVGLMRGFLQAGARSLLVTLWEIDDSSTHEFMRAFYGFLAVGEPLARAVQKAMLAVRERFPHPYFWAPFLLVGDPDTVISLET
jgi:CHAT domain-containing protein